MGQVIASNARQHLLSVAAGLCSNALSAAALDPAAGHLCWLLALFVHGSMKAPQIELCRQLSQLRRHRLMVSDAICDWCFVA